MESDIEIPVTTVRFLATAGCSLSTLHFTFSFYSDNRKTTYTKRPYDEPLLQAIATIDLRCKITTVAMAFDKEYTTRFDYMVNWLGLIKQWAITEDISGAEPCNGSRHHTREWVLKPADASTIGKVPSSDGVDKVYRRLEGLA